MCISACDGLAILLKVGHRATLIGTTTNGTGAGFIGDGVFEDVQWRDRYQVVSLRIPNRLFGYGGALGQHVFSDPNAFIDMNSENRPVAADITYDSTLSDVTNNSEGWYTKAIDTLNQP